MTKYTLVPTAQEIAHAASKPAGAAITAIVTVDRYDHVAAAAYLMRHHGVTALPVLDGDRCPLPMGIITETDIRQAAAEGEDLDQVRVLRLMSQSDRSVG